MERPYSRRKHYEAGKPGKGPHFPGPVKSPHLNDGSIEVDTVRIIMLVSVASGPYAGAGT